MARETSLNGHSRLLNPFEIPIAPKPGQHSLKVDHPICKAFLTFEDTDKIVGQLQAAISLCGPTSKVTILIEERVA